MELDIMPYCEGCLYFEPERVLNIDYIGGSQKFDQNASFSVREIAKHEDCKDAIVICCRYRDVCKRMERKMKGDEQSGT